MHYEMVSRVSSSIYYHGCFVYNIIIMKKYVPVEAAVVV